MRWSVFLVVVLPATVLATGLPWLTGLPLGVPGEWTWDRIPVASFPAEIVLGAVPALIAGALLVLLAWAGTRRIAIASRRETAGWLLGLSVAGLAWLLTVQSALVEPWNLAKAPLVIYYPGMTGYFHRARYGIHDTREFLSGYHELMAEGDVLHVGTHPPGLFLIHRGLIGAAERWPGLAGWIGSTAPESVQRGFESIDVGLSRTGSRLEPLDRAVLWTATLLAHAAAACVVWPLFGLLRLSVDREAAWRLVVFWPLLPAVAIFLPRSDVAFALPATLLVWTWLRAVQRRSIVAAAIAATIGLAALSCSLAFLPIGLIAVLAAWTAAGPTDSAGSLPAARIGWRQRVAWLSRPVLAAALTFAALIIVVAWWFDLTLPAVWLQNWQNHAAFYDQYPRTWWKWLLVNPVELALAAGVPVIALAGAAAVCVWRHGPVLRPAGGLSVEPVLELTAGRGTPVCGLHRMAVAAVLAVWGLLWLSGKNSGEAARLWIPLCPLLLWMAAGVRFPSAGERVSWQRHPATDAGDSADPPAPRLWLALLILQLAASLLTVLRVSGYHFPGPVPGP